MGKEMGWDGPCVGGQKEEKEEKRRAPSFNPVDLGRAWQATSNKPTLGDLTNRSTTSFFGRVQCVHRPAQPASLAWQPRQAHCGKKNPTCFWVTPAVFACQWRGRDVAGRVVVQWSVRGGSRLRVLSAKRDGWCAHSSGWSGGILTSGFWFCQNGAVRVSSR